MSSKPIEQANRDNDEPAESGAVPRSRQGSAAEERAASDHSGQDFGTEQVHTQSLTPGAVLDQGRYRLLSRVGSDARCHTELWRAKDGVLGRDVALTILVGDVSDTDATADARRTLERAMHASTFNHVGVARVLDVVSRSPGDPQGVLGLVIAEWTHGTDVLDLVAEGPLPPGTAARVLQPLASAVESAHHAGLVLGADHPQRIRVTSDGTVRMAFPGPHPRATSYEDVRGLGAALYLLLTGRWALAEDDSRVSAASSGPDGAVIAPRTLRPTVPLELSTVAVRALGTADSAGTSGGVRTGAAVLRVLEQHATHESGTAVMPSVSTSENEVWRTEDPKPDARKRKKLLISGSFLGLATLLVLGWIIAGVLGIFVGPQESSGPSVVLGPDGKVIKPAGPSAAVGITGAEVFVTERDKDSANRAPLVFDGNPVTSWATSEYKDQLGSGFKNGVGLVLSLAHPTQVREVTIDSPTPGTKVEIRAASGMAPRLESSPVIGSADLRHGKNTIPVQSPQPTQHVLIWITHLAKDGQYRSQINELTVNGSAG